MSTGRRSVASCYIEYCWPRYVVHESRVVYVNANQGAHCSCLQQSQVAVSLWYNSECDLKGEGIS